MDLFTSTRNEDQTQHFNRHEKMAYKKGYREKKGNLYSPTGKKMKLWPSTTGYLIFSFPTGSRTDGTRKMRKVLFHRLVAYQKYKDVLYSFQCVRHKDGDKMNNNPENIEPGSHKVNMMDVPKKVRVDRSITAACHIRKFSDKVVEEIREQHSSYKETMDKYGISSKGTLWSILNRNYVTEKVG